MVFQMTLAKSLLNNTSLTTLNLCFNYISDYGTQALIKSLKNIKCLKVHSQRDRHAANTLGIVESGKVSGVIVPYKFKTKCRSFHSF